MKMWEGAEKPKEDPAENCLSVSSEDTLKEFRKALTGLKGVKVSADDDFLLHFLRYKDFDIPTAVKSYKSNAQWRETHKEYLKIPFSRCVPFFNRNVLSILKKRDENGPLIFCLHATRWEPSQEDMEITLRSFHFVLDEALKDPKTQVNGTGLILDLTGLTAAQTVEYISYFTMSKIRLIVTYGCGGYPIKLKCFYVLSCAWVVVQAYNAVKYLIKKKIRQRIHFECEGVSALLKYEKKDDLPQSLGGNIPDEEAFDTDIFRALFKSENHVYGDN